MLNVIPSKILTTAYCDNHKEDNHTPEVGLAYVRHTLLYTDLVHKTNICRK
jgi:hypothetical protein